jgi:hypothetical protein
VATLKIIVPEHDRHLCARKDPVSFLIGGNRCSTRHIACKNWCAKRIRISALSICNCSGFFAS